MQNVSKKQPAAPIIDAAAAVDFLFASKLTRWEGGGVAGRGRPSIRVAPRRTDRKPLSLPPSLPPSETRRLMAAQVSPPRGQGGQVRYGKQTEALGEASSMLSDNWKHPSKCDGDDEGLCWGNKSGLIAAEC